MSNKADPSISDFSGLFGTFRDFSGLFGTFRDFSGLFGTFWKRRKGWNGAVGRSIVDEMTGQHDSGNAVEELGVPVDAQRL